MTKVILGAGETVHLQATAKVRPVGDTFYGSYLATLTSKRIFAEDPMATLIFNYYFKDVDRAEIRTSFWTGASIRLVLRDGNDFTFTLMKDLTTVDKAACTIWVNTINQVILVLRNQAPQSQTA